MEIIYLITYKEDNTIEGYVKKKDDFDSWLVAHNRQRKEEGSIIEYKDEFEIKEIIKLWK